MCAGCAKIGENRALVQARGRAPCGRRERKRPGPLTGADRARPYPATPNRRRHAVSEGVRRYFPVSWEEMHRDSRALSWRLADRGPWQGIVAIARGGLVPAQIVARELELRLIDTICVS